MLDLESQPLRREAWIELDPNYKQELGKLAMKNKHDLEPVVQTYVDYNVLRDLEERIDDWLDLAVTETSIDKK